MGAIDGPKLDRQMRNVQTEDVRPPHENTSRMNDSVQFNCFEMGQCVG